jgi:uncharacterized membrane protein
MLDNTHKTGSMVVFLVTLVGMAGAAACSGSSANANRAATAPINCAEGKTAKFSELTGFAKCTGCHASTRSGDARMSAPASVNFDNFVAAKANVEAGLEQIDSRSMPPSGTPGLGDLELSAIRRWLACGTPE